LPNRGELDGEEFVHPSSPHVRLLGAQVLTTISLVLFVRLFLILTTLLCVSLLDGLAFWAGFLLLGI
jgi:hypothetical protein